MSNIASDSLIRTVGEIYTCQLFFCETLRLNCIKALTDLKFEMLKFYIVWPWYLKNNDF